MFAAVCSTVTDAVAVVPSAVARSSAVPLPTAVTSPLSFTVNTDPSELAQVMEGLLNWPIASRTSARNCLV